VVWGNSLKAVYIPAAKQSSLWPVQAICSPFKSRQSTLPFQGPARRELATILLRVCKIPHRWPPRDGKYQQLIIRDNRSSCSAPVVLSRTASHMVHHDTDTTLLPPLHLQHVKQTSTADVNSGACLHYSHRPPSITDKSSKCWFLKDTGSHFCVSSRKLVPQRRSRIHSTTTRLMTLPSHLRTTAS
jgi:hypothetical protein